MKTNFTIFRVQNGWIVQCYAGSTSFSPTDAKDVRQTYVFTDARAMAAFIVSLK